MELGLISNFFLSLVGVGVGVGVKVGPRPENMQSRKTMMSHTTILAAVMRKIMGVLV